MLSFNAIVTYKNAEPEHVAVLNEENVFINKKDVGYLISGNNQELSPGCLEHLLGVQEIWNMFQKLGCFNPHFQFRNNVTGVHFTLSFIKEGIFINSFNINDLPEKELNVMSELLSGYPRFLALFGMVIEEQGSELITETIAVEVEEQAQVLYEKAESLIEEAEVLVEEAEALMEEAEVLVEEAELPTEEAEALVEEAKLPTEEADTEAIVDEKAKKKPRAPKKK